MKIKHALMGLAFVCLSTSALADAKSDDVLQQSVSGSDYENWNAYSRMGYVEGAVDGLINGADASGDYPRASQLGRCIKGMSMQQLVAIVDKYMSDHPTQWDNHGMGALIYVALERACPVRGFPLPASR
jgi:hypothetical protein